MFAITESSSVPEIAIEVHETQKTSLMSHLKSYKLRSKVSIDEAKYVSRHWRVSPDSSQDNGLVVSDPRHSSFGFRSLSTDVSGKS